MLCAGYLKKKKKRKINLEGMNSSLWCDVYAHSPQMLTVDRGKQHFSKGRRESCGLVCTRCSVQASTGDSMSDGIKFRLPREPGRADGSMLLPRSTDFKDVARDGAREDARDRGTDGAREDAREDTPGFTEPLRETALTGSATTGSIRPFSVMVIFMTASVDYSTGGASDCWRDAAS